MQGSNFGMLASCQPAAKRRHRQLENDVCGWAVRAALYRGYVLVIRPGGNWSSVAEGRMCCSQVPF